MTNKVHSNLQKPLGLTQSSATQAPSSEAKKLLPPRLIPPNNPPKYFDREVTYCLDGKHITFECNELDYFFKIIDFTKIKDNYRVRDMAKNLHSGFSCEDFEFRQFGHDVTPQEFVDGMTYLMDSFSSSRNSTQNKEFLEELPVQYLEYLRITRSPYYEEAVKVIDEWKINLQKENPKWHLK